MKESKVIDEIIISSRALTTSLTTTFSYIFPPLYPPQIFKVNDDFNIFIIHPITFSLSLSTRQNKKMLQIPKNMLKSLATFFDHFDDSLGEIWAEFRGIEAAPLYI